MGIETARRVRDQVREGLAELIRLVNDPSTPIADVREVLSESKALGAQVSVLQADAAVVVAARERHGDSGVGVLARSAGLSRRDAAGQVQTAQSLQSMPAVRDAVETGQISVANAKTLARASAKTSAAQVDGDAELLEKAAEMSVEQFVREAGRWAVKRQDDGGEGEYRRQRARRRLSIWDGDDGMVHLRGELDPVAGAKVRKRFLLEAERLRRVDLHSPGGEKRSLNQRMADSLDTLTEHGSVYSKAGSATPSGHGRGGTGVATNASRGVSESDRGSSEDRGGVSQNGKCGDASQASGEVSHAESARLSLTSGGDDSSRTIGDRKCGCGGRPSADITIVQHLSADGTAAFAEIAGGGVIPPSVLEEYFCTITVGGWCPTGGAFTPSHRLSGLATDPHTPPTPRQPTGPRRRAIQQGTPGQAPSPGRHLTERIRPEAPWPKPSSPSRCSPSPSWCLAGSVSPTGTRAGGR